MKCPKCNGKGKVLDYVAERNCHGEWEKVLREIPCDKCQRKPMTNEEWLHTLNTEQLAEWLSQRDCDDLPVDATEVKEILKKEWMEWLKQPKE